MNSSHHQVVGSLSGVQLHSNFQYLQSILFPSVSTVDRTAWATLQDSQEDILREYTHTKVRILHSMRIS